MATPRTPDDPEHSPQGSRPNPPTCQRNLHQPKSPQTPEPSHQFVDDQLCTISVLDVSRMDHHGQQQPHGIHYDVALSTVDLLASVIATRPPFSVVLTDWLSMMAALGVGSLPADLRTAERRVSLTRSHVPSRLHFRKYHHTVPQGGKSCGSARQVHPVAHNVQDAVDHLPDIDRTWPSSRLGCWKQRCKNFPLGITQIAGVWFPVHDP